MPTTRSSEKNTEAQANGSSDQASGTKHEIEEKTSPAAKRAKKDDEKTQKTIEETMPEYVLCISIFPVLLSLTYLIQRQRR